MGFVSPVLPAVDPEIIAPIRIGMAGERSGLKSECPRAVVDPGQGHVHSAYNPGPGVTVLVATFFDAPEAGSLLIPANDPGC